MPGSVEVFAQDTGVINIVFEGSRLAGVHDGSIHVQAKGCPCVGEVAQGVTDVTNNSLLTLYPSPKLAPRRGQCSTMAFYVAGPRHHQGPFHILVAWR